jgi:hypothetical protein
MLPDYSAIAWLLIVFSVYLTGASKGGFAGGFGTFSVLLVMDVFAVKACGYKAASTRHCFTDW